MPSFLTHYHGFLVQELIKIFTDLPKIPIVSVGSGGGYLETALKNLHNDLNFVLVDPTPDSFETKEDLGCTPNFKTVGDLIAQIPEIVNECCVLLPWCFPNDSTYDLEAVVALNPKHIVVLYECIGGACGYQFHTWLQSGDIVKNDATLILSYADPVEVKVSLPKSVYQVGCVWKNFYRTSIKMGIESALLLTRNDLQNLLIDPFHISRGLDITDTEENFAHRAMYSCSLQ